jgi:hypothetical protein
VTRAACVRVHCDPECKVCKGTPPTDAEVCATRRKNSPELVCDGCLGDGSRAAVLVDEDAA